MNNTTIHLQADTKLGITCDTKAYIPLRSWDLSQVTCTKCLRKARKEGK